MGRKSRPAPRHLGRKLKAIRRRLNLSQTDMLCLIKPGEDKDHRAMISEYERGVKTPHCVELLRYARLAEVSTDVLIDDALKLTSGKTKESPRGSLGTEQLTVAAPGRTLDIIDNVYLELLYETPRLLRPHLTRDYFYRTIVGSSIGDYLDNPTENSLTANWQKLILRIAARLEKRTGSGGKSEAE